MKNEECNATLSKREFATALKSSSTVSAARLLILLMPIYSIALFTIHFYLPIGYALPNVVVPLIPRKVALDVLLQPLANERQRD